MCRFLQLCKNRHIVPYRYQEFELIAYSNSVLYLCSACVFRMRFHMLILYAYSCLVLLGYDMMYVDDRL